MTSLGRAFVRTIAISLFVFVVAVTGPSSPAQTTTDWTGTTGNWSNSSNWDNGVPNGNYNSNIGERFVSDTNSKPRHQRDGQQSNPRLWRCGYHSWQ